MKRRLARFPILILAAWSSVGLVSPRPVTASGGKPGAAMIQTVVAGESSATVTWSAPTDNGASPVTSYVVASIPTGLKVTTLGIYRTATLAGLTNGTSYTFTVTAKNAAGAGPPSHRSQAVVPGHPGAQFHPLPAYRVCDTRPRNPSQLTGTDTQCNGKSSAGTTLTSGSTISVVVAGTNPTGKSSGGVPAAGVTSVVLNVTAMNTSAQSSLTVWAAGTPRPRAYSVSWAARQIAPNLVVVPVGAGGKISVYNKSGNVDLTIDVNGYHSPDATSAAGLEQGLTPYRVCDTRPHNPSKLAEGDAQCNGAKNAGTTLAPAGTLDAQIGGTNPSGQTFGGVPAAGVSAVILNVTAASDGAGSLLVWAQGSLKPALATLSWAKGETVQERVVLALGATGKVSVFNSQGNTDIAIDVNGYYTDGSDPKASGSYLTGLTATRVCDTRPGNPSHLSGPAAQCNGARQAGHTLKAGQPLAINAAGLGGVPPEASAAPPTAALLSVTVINTSADSSLFIWPAGAAPSVLSEAHWAAHGTTGTLIVASLGAGGQVLLRISQGAADVLVDVVGYESGGLFIPSSTIPLSTPTVASLESMHYNPSTDTSNLVFKGDPAQVRALVRGQVINAGPSSAAPYGILQRVTAVNTSGSQVAVTTVPASVSDVLTEGSLSYASARTNYASTLGKAAARLHVGGSRRHAAGGSLNGTAPCGQLGGSVGFDAQVPNFSLTPNFSPHWSPLANFSADATMRFDLGYSMSLHASGSVNCEKDVQVIPSMELAPSSVVDVGPIAFTLTPIGSVDFVLSVKGKASVSASITTAFYLQAGLHFDTDNGFSVTHDNGCDTPVPQGTPGCTEHSTTPKTGVSLALSGGLRFQVTLAVDYVPDATLVGPFVAFVPSVEINLRPQAPILTMDLHLKIQVGLEFHVWILNISKTWDLADLRWTIFHSVVPTTTSDLPPAVATSPYSTNLSADGGFGPYTWSLPPGSGAPPWLSLSPKGELTGTPPPRAANSSPTFQVAVSDRGLDSATSPFTLAVGPPVSLDTRFLPSPDSLPEAIIGQNYGYSLSATGGTFPYRFTAAGLPAWLSIDASGLLSGTPPSGTGGTATPISVTVKDSTRVPTQDGPHVLNLTVKPFGVTTTTLPDASVTQYYSVSLSAANGIEPYTWSLDPSPNSLPSWLSLAADGTLSGTPPSNASGTSTTFVVDVADSASPLDLATVTLTLAVSPWTITQLQGLLAYVQRVSCVSSTGCMASGYIGRGDGFPEPLAERWDGTRWTTEPVSQPPGATTGGLSGVSCAHRKFCMAVGFWGPSNPAIPPNTLPLAVIWNGNAWTVVRNPPGIDQQAAQSEYGGIGLDQISCTDRSFCMATLDGARSGGSIEQWAALSGWSMLCQRRTAPTTKVVTSRISPAQIPSSVLLSGGTVKAHWLNAGTATRGRLPRLRYLREAKDLGLVWMPRRALRRPVVLRSASGRTAKSAVSTT